MYDVGTQCCFDPITLKNVATQTDKNEAIARPNVHVTVMSNNDQPLPVLFHANAEEWKIKNDHSYAMQVPPPLIFPSYEDDSFNAASPPPMHEVEVSNTENDGCDNESDDDDDDDDDDDCGKDDEDQDPNWQLPYDEKLTKEDDNILSEEEFEGDSSTQDSEKKFIVFDSCLSTLLKRCPECGDIIAQHERKTTGSMLSVKLTCHSGHTINWDSQPVVKRKPLGNLLLAASILFTGNTFAAISRFASCFNLQFFSESVFYDTQQKYLFPVINEAWEAESRRQIEMLCAKEVVNLDGDGRCDSPGHSAKYGTYTLMEEDTGNVVAFNVVQVSEVTSSNAMEKEGFSRCIELLESKDVTISRIATDRHVTITSCMARNHPHINHQHDVWHLSKWVVKKLTNKAKQKGCEELSPWIQSISNHLWWSAATCDGNVNILREKWRSVLDHITNKHKWSGNTHFHQCCHRRISSSEAKNICWLKPGTQAHLALEEVVLNTKLLKDLAKLTDFCHTGKLEVYHSMMLKYCSKREHFSYQGMVARTQLAALDNNANTGRIQAQVQSGERAGEARYKLCFPKANKRWVVKPITEKKSYHYLSDLLSQVIKRCEEGNAAAQPVPVHLPRNIASKPAPLKADLIQQHRSRFNT
ncbi:uncharacterized protein LOC144637699 [Oculina patagonica]